jgi:hypothetical protein
MNTTVEVAAIAAPSVLALAALFVTAAAHEWLGFSVSVSLRVIPASKRKPRSAVEVKVVPAEPAAPVESITAARRPA